MKLPKALKNFLSDAPSRILGIDIGSQNVKMAEVQFGKVPRVVNVVNAELPADLCNNGYITQTEAITAFIRNLLERNNVAAKHVAFSIGGRNAFIREITLPPMPVNEMRTAAIYDAGTYVPYDANSYYADAAVFGSPNAEQQQPVLLVAAPRENIDTMLDIADALHLKPVYIDIEVLCCYRLMAEQYENFVLCDMGQAYSLVTIFQSGAPVAQRSIQSSGRMVDDAIASALGCSLAEAEDTKLKEDILGRSDVDEIRERYAQVFQLIDDMDRDISLTCEYYRNNNRTAKFTNLVLTGGAANMKGLAEYLRKQENIPVEVIDVKGRVEVSDAMSYQKQHNVLPSCTVAIGAALAGGLERD